MNNVMQAFLDVLHGHGLAPEEIIPDGKLHRCPTLEKPKKRNGAYIAHLDKPSTLWWCNWETGEQETYCAEEKQAFSPSELLAWQERQRAIKRQREAECARRHAEATQQAKTEWEAASPCNPEHSYLRKKGIAPLDGIRQNNDNALLVPVLDDSGAMQSLQRIYPDGTKRFLVGGKVQGGHFVIHGQPEKPLAICEGLATGASIHQATGSAIYVAFSANNLQAIALSARRKYPESAIIICADNDETGRKRAEEAAKAASAKFVVPVFTKGNGTDFNDLHQTEGFETVRRQLEAAQDTQPGLVALDMDKFLSMEIPDRGFLLSPILPVHGIGILCAPRGVGKTFAALSVVVAVASGGEVFNWRAPMPKKTLYVDGEMPVTSMQTRLSSIIGGMSARHRL